MLVFFFFQAEDGIRDYKVTGVQTCALPIWLPLAEATTRDPVSVTAWTLPTMTSGVDISRQISLRSLTRSRPWARCLRESYRPLVLMASSMPDRRRVSLAPVNTLAPSGIRSLMRLRAAAASSRISTVKPCAVSATAARSRRCAGAGSVNSVAAVGVVTVPPGLVGGRRVVWFVLLSSTTTQPPGMSDDAPTSHSGALSCRTAEDRCEPRRRRHHDHAIRARARSARPGPGRDHERAPPADQPRLPAPWLPGRGRGCRPGGLRPLVCHDRAAAGCHRIPRRLADDGRQPHLPQPARLGSGPARALRGRMAA